MNICNKKLGSERGIKIKIKLALPASQQDLKFIMNRSIRLPHTQKLHLPSLLSDLLFANGSIQKNYDLNFRPA